MSDSTVFEAQQELAERKRDAMDKLRTDTARHLRKYARRIKLEGEARVDAAFTLDPGVDPEKAADDALRIASRGMFTGNSAQAVIDSAPAPAVTE